MKTFIHIISIAFILALNYSCKKKIPVIEHSISGVLYLDHTLQPAANYEVRLQYNSQAYSLRDTKILDECTTDENGNFYLKYVKIAGAGELEIENNGGTALLTEIPVNEDIEFSFPIKPFTNLDVNFNYNRPLEVGDSVFIYAPHILNPEKHQSIVYIDKIKQYYFMLTSINQPNNISALTVGGISYRQLIDFESNNINDCFALAMGYGLNNTIYSDSILRALRFYTNNLNDSSVNYYCYNPNKNDYFNLELTIDINLPD